MRRHDALPLAMPSRWPHLGVVRGTDARHAVRANPRHGPPARVATVRF